MFFAREDTIKKAIEAARLNGAGKGIVATLLQVLEDVRNRDHHALRRRANYMVRAQDDSGDMPCNAPRS